MVFQYPIVAVTENHKEVTGYLSLLVLAAVLKSGADADVWRAACLQDAERRAAVVQQRAEQVRKELNPLNSPLVQKYFQK